MRRRWKLTYADGVEQEYECEDSWGLVTVAMYGPTIYMKTLTDGELERVRESLVSVALMGAV